MTASPRPRVVLVDDDPMIRRLVAMALDDLPIELVSCASGVEALAALRERPARLLLTDLMMPDMSGFELLQRVLDEPSLHAGALLAVFSAGLHADAKARLADLPVWRLISKPVSVIDLAATVEEAVAGPAGRSPDAPSHDPGHGRATVDGGHGDGAAESGAGEATGDAAEAAAIRDHFAGNEPLFRAFKADCLVQFAEDLAQGRAAVERQDAPALRRLAHSLKSVLLTLGLAQASESARRLEHAAAAGDWAACGPPWQALQDALTRLSTAHPGGDHPSR